MYATCTLAGRVCTTCQIASISCLRPCTRSVPPRPQLRLATPRAQRTPSPSHLADHVGVVRTLVPKRDCRVHTLPPPTECQRSEPASRARAGIPGRPGPPEAQGFAAFHRPLWASLYPLAGSWNETFPWLHISARTNGSARPWIAANMIRQSRPLDIGRARRQCNSPTHRNQTMRRVLLDRDHRTSALGLYRLCSSWSPAGTRNGVTGHDALYRRSGCRKHYSCYDFPGQAYANSPRRQQ